jgi:hypothetical protein
MKSRLGYLFGKTVMGICVQKAACRFLLKSRFGYCKSKTPKLNPQRRPNGHKLDGSVAD